MFLILGLRKTLMLITFESKKNIIRVINAMNRQIGNNVQGCLREIRLMWHSGGVLLIHFLLKWSGGSMLHD